MKQSETLIPCCFDDKDIIVDYDLWLYFFNDNCIEPISFCTGNADTESIFFLPNFKHDRIFRANIPYSQWNNIEVTCLQDNGTIWASDVKELEELFMAWNNEEDSDIYVTCEPTQEHDGRYVALTFKYYHTDV